MGRRPRDPLLRRRALGGAGDGAAGAPAMFGIVGGDSLAGPMRLEAECRVVNIMGGADLNLNQAVLADGEVTIRIFSLVGGTTVQRGPRKPALALAGPRAHRAAALLSGRQLSGAD